MDLTKYDLYILDYDGTLLDSMPMWRDSAKSYISYLGKTPAPDLDDRIPIFTDRYCAEVIKEEYNLIPTVDEILKDIDHFVDMTYPKVPLKKGAIEFLDKLKALGKKIVVLSASGDHILDLSMNALGIKGYFDMVISVYNHPTLSKMDGTAFEYVRRIFNIEKKDMILFDDSISNILGAEAYGIERISVFDEYSKKHKDEFQMHSLKYLTMEEISKLI
jgi:HAD superfamily hydrolase (TIGR01509 family)